MSEARTAPRVMITTDCVITSGHIQTASQLAQALRDQGCEVLISSGRTAFDKMRGFDYRGITCHVRPSMVSAATPEKPFASLTPGGLDYLDDTLFQQERLADLIQTYRDFKPDIVISEMWPAGHVRLGAEMNPFMEYVRGQPRRPTCINLARDVLLPIEMGSETAASIVGTLDRFFDAMIVRGGEALIPIEQSFGDEVKKLAGKIHYAGYMIDPDEVAEEQGPPSVVVSAGGGYQAGNREIFLQAIRARLNVRPELALAPWRFFISPLCPETDKEAFAAAAQEVVAGLKTKYPGQTVEPFHLGEISPDFTSHLKHCRLAILRGGTSALEAAIMGKPTVVVPFLAPGRTPHNAEQAVRTAILAKKLPHVAYVHESELQCTIALSQAVQELAQQPSAGESVPGITGGSRRAARMVLDIHGQRSPQPIVHEWELGSKLSERIFRG